MIIKNKPIKENGFVGLYISLNHSSMIYLKKYSIIFSDQNIGSIIKHKLISIIIISSYHRNKANEYKLLKI